LPDILAKAEFKFMNKYFLIIGGLFLLIFGSLNISAQEKGSSEPDKKDVVVAGKPISMPLPPYPKKARPEMASGTVEVQVTVNENGKVIAAKAISGHQLLRSAAEKAALKAKFTPTLSGEKPIKANAVLVYNFVP
jgi:TonB family protein